ncbi:MAG: extracellular solute-binding protein [Chloroflexi bacterium]|nr:extracellular solute-binding protein [Chloroflexota bacterium]
MIKKLMIITILVLLVVASFSAHQPAAARQSVTLRLWQHQEGPFNEATQSLIDAYTALHPEVTIEVETFEYNLYLQSLQTSLPAGDEADILELFGTWVCGYSDFLAPMPDELTASFDASQFYGAPLGGYQCDDQTYGLPQEFNVEYGTVLVNKAMFEEAGLSFPPAWENWDALISDAQQLAQENSDGQMTVAGYHFTNADAIVFSFLAGILQRGGDYWNEDRDGFQFDTDEARETLEQMLHMVDEGVVDPVLFNDTSNWAGDAFFTNQVAIALIGPWAVAYGLDSFPDFGEFDYVALPSSGDDPTFAADSGWGMTVSKRSDHQDVAWDFINFAAANADNALQWNITTGTIPALRGLVEDEMYRPTLIEASPWLANVLGELQYGRYVGDMPDRDLLFYDIIYPYVLDTLQGLMSPEDAVALMEEDANLMFEE